MTPCAPTAPSSARWRRAELKMVERNRRVQVTAAKPWPNFPAQAGKTRSILREQHLLQRERPAGTERKFAQQRVRMEGWRQRRMSSEEDHSTSKGNYKTGLTLTGLLMEGLEGVARSNPEQLDIEQLSGGRQQ